MLRFRLDSLLFLRRNAKFLGLPLNSLRNSPIMTAMKSIVFLYAGFSSGHAFDILFSSQSACGRALAWAKTVPGAAGVVVAAVPGTEGRVREALDACGLQGAELVVQPAWTTAQLLAQLAASAAGARADCAVYAAADCPFLDAGLTAELLGAHERYLAEYSFADGYPAGLAPEVIATGTLAILAELAAGSQKAAGDAPVAEGCIFNVIKGDINSFEIETVIAPEDFRMLRLSFCCTSKAGSLACARLFELARGQGAADALSLSRLAARSAGVQRTVPAFYNIQIAANCTSAALYNPYPALYKEKNGVLPFAAGNPQPADMGRKDFRSVLEAAAALSGTAVIGLGSFTEPLAVQGIEAYVQDVLSFPGLSVLIETDGSLVTEALADSIAAVARQAPPRTNGMDAVTWIVAVDAVSEETYRAVHALPPELGAEGQGTSLAGAVQALGVLAARFPGAVYPQFVRMNRNEHELEQFYRLYHDAASVSGGKLIIQKYDSFCGLLPDEKPADLSPLGRQACWHLKRDMCVLPDGSVPLCREYVLDAPVGNVLKEPLADVWERGRDVLVRQLDTQYDEKCRKCDEYYTFNF